MFVNPFLVNVLILNPLKTQPVFGFLAFPGGRKWSEMTRNDLSIWNSPMISLTEEYFRENFLDNVFYLFLKISIFSQKNSRIFDQNIHIFHISSEKSFPGIVKYKAPEILEKLENTCKYLRKWKYLLPKPFILKKCANEFWKRQILWASRNISRSYI